MSKSLVELKPELQALLGENCRFLILKVTPLTGTEDANLEYCATMSHTFALRCLMSLLRRLLLEVLPHERAEFLAEQSTQERESISGSKKETLN